MLIVTRRPVRRRILPVHLLASLLAALVCAPAAAEEPFREMLDGLRARGYYDVALDYLADMRTSKLLSESLRPTVSYEQGRTLIDAAIQQRDFTRRGRDLDEAVAKLQEFLAASPAHPLAGSAALQMGNVLVERGRMAVEASQRSSQQAQKPALLKQARDLFAEAGRVFGEAEKKFKLRLESFEGLSEKDPKNKAKVEARDQLRRDAIQSQMYSGGVLQEMAGTFADGSDDSKKLLQQAADKYESIYQAYRRRLAGLQARIKQAECYREMGDTKQALALYADILNQPDDKEDIRELKATALYLSMEAWTSPTENKAELAASKGEQWLRAAHGPEDRKPQWLATRYFAALAHKQLADALKPNDPKRDQQLAAAKDHATRVARVASPYQDAAKALVAQLAGLDPNSQQPTTFAEALERGKAALDDMTAKETQIRLAPAMKNEAQIPGLKEEALADRDRAKHFFNLAVKLRDSSTPLEDLNSARYYLCFLDYQLGHYYDAAVLGEFVARHYPDSAGARPSARIALASYLQGFNDRDERAAASRSFDRQKMTGLVEFMAKRWPNEPEVEEAFAIMMAVATFDRDLDDAARWLAKIPAKSPRRADSELKLGEAYRDAYVRAQDDDGPHKPSAAAIDALAKQAETLLGQGLARSRTKVNAGEPVTAEMVAAGLMLAEMQVNAGEPQKAIEVLDDAKIGPLALARAKSPLAASGNFPADTLKVALRAYVAVQNLDQAEAVMNQLDQLMAGKGGAGQGDLTKIYIQLGLSLESQVTNLRKTNKSAELERVTKAFEKFLERIGSRTSGNNFSSLNWVAETFASLAGGYDAGGPKLSTQAKSYYQRALSTDERILATAAKDPAFLPSADALLVVKLREALCLRRLGEYKRAVDLLESVLLQRQQLLDAQVAAAQAYMDWGTMNPLYYNLAILGARKSSRDANGRETNTIWGWTKLATMLGSNPTHRKVYHEARLNAARCRMLQAEAHTGEDKRKLLKLAAYEIYLTQRLVPDLGGPEMREKYDQLLKTIQKLAGEQPVGLKAFQPATGTSAVTAAAK
ncbi:MAG TPA: hypothetical protein VHV55_11855 [Pirellulales bacterium]|nr:hypothetical protein [Pirellulales bacterium]